MSTGLNLYRIIFADLSSRDFTAADVGAVYDALGSPVNPIVGIQLLRSNVSSGAVSDQTPQVPVTPVTPPPVYPYPYPPCPPEPPRPAEKPVYVNRLMLGDVSQLYQPDIPFGVKTPEAYRADFVELKRARNVYQFAVPAFLGGEQTVISSILPSNVYFDATGGYAVVTFSSFWKGAEDTGKHLWVTTLRIYIDHIEGSSEDVTLQQANVTLDKVALIPTSYNIRVPLQEADFVTAFYPASGQDWIFKGRDRAWLLTYFPDKSLASYQEDYEAVAVLKKEIKFEIPGAHGNPVRVTSLASDYGVDESGKRCAWCSFVTVAGAGIWMHTAKFWDQGDIANTVIPFNLESIKVYG